MPIGTWNLDMLFVLVRGRRQKYGDERRGGESVESDGWTHFGNIAMPSYYYIRPKFPWEMNRDKVAPQKHFSNFIKQLFLKFFSWCSLSLMQGVALATQVSLFLMPGVALATKLVCLLGGIHFF